MKSDSAPAIASPQGLTPLEVASGLVLGPVDVPDDESSERSRPAGVAAPRPVGEPLAALEKAILPALRRPPCVVSFSGGMDSSFVLAVAERVARRAALPPPVPMTWRFTDAPAAEESAAQERIIGALGLTEWSIRWAYDELDFVGPVARQMLSRYGYMYPANLHLHLPIIEAAAGGSLVTGIAGDQILAGFRRAARRWPPPRPRTLARRARSAARRLGAPDPLPWLYPDVSRQVALAARADEKAEPRAGAARIRWHARHRAVAISCTGLSAVAADHDVFLVNPFVDPDFVVALAAMVGRKPLPRRAELLARIAGGAFPPVLTDHRPKAAFGAALLRSATRDFVSTWDGTGVDEELVDIPGLRAIWSRWPIPLQTAGLAQQAWLAAAKPTNGPARAGV